MPALISLREAIITIAGLILIRVNLAKDTLHIGVLVSVEGDLNLSGYIPAMNMAVETINNDTTLPFDFSVTLNDSMVRTGPYIYDERVSNDREWVSSTLRYIAIPALYS